MAPDDLELTAEFCALVGAPNLLVYLNLPEGVSSQEARDALKARRKFMQGMQSNPKYKKEALFLIRHFANLNEVLEEPNVYLADTRQRSESIHLPVIEMTIRGVLGTGTPPTREQIDYLRRNATELGVSERTFRRRLYQISAELGTVLPSHLDIDASVSVEDGPPEVPPEIHTSQSGSMTGPGLYEAARHAPHPAAWGTVQRPKPSDAPTVFLNRESEDEPGTPRLEILGEPRRRLRLGGRVPEIRIRNGGDGDMSGTITTDVDWLKVHPERLDPTAREQVVAVRVSSQRLARGPAVGSVVIATDAGERARVVYEVRRGLSTWSVLAALVFMGVAFAIAGWVLAQVLLGA